MSCSSQSPVTSIIGDLTSLDYMGAYITCSCNKHRCTHTHTIKKKKMVNSIKLLPPMSQREVYLSDMYSIAPATDQKASIIYDMITVLAVSGFHSWNLYSYLKLNLLLTAASIASTRKLDST